MEQTTVLLSAAGGLVSAIVYLFQDIQSKNKKTESRLEMTEAGLAECVKDRKVMHGQLETQEAQLTQQGLQMKEMIELVRQIRDKGDE